MINQDDNLDIDQTAETPAKKPGLSNISVSRPVLYGGLLAALALGIGVFYFTQTPGDPLAAVDPTTTVTPVATDPNTPATATAANPATPSRTLEVQQIPLLATTPVTPPAGKPSKPASTATTQVVRPSAPRNVNPFAPLPTSVPNAPTFNPPQQTPPSAPLPTVNNSPLPSVAATNTAPNVVIKNPTPLPFVPGVFAPLKPVPSAVATSKPSVRVPNTATPTTQPARPTVTRPVTTIAAGALPVAPPILQNTTIPRPNPIRPTPVTPPVIRPSPPATPPSVQPTPPTPPVVTPAAPPPAVTPTPPPATPPESPPAPPVNPEPAPTAPQPSPEPATPPVNPIPPATPPVTQVVTPPAAPAVNADLITLEKYVQDNSLQYQGFVAGTTTQGAFSSSQNAFFLIALGEKFAGSSIALKSADELQAVLSLGTQTLTLKKK